MVLKFKKRSSQDRRKVLIYGEDGTGKSTFAANYCKENNLKPVIIDIDDTNFTEYPILDLDFSTDIKAFRNISSAIQEVNASPEFDTIILDGVTSMLERFVSKAKGIKKYGDRAERFNGILDELINSSLNLIFIGQIDMKVIHDEEFQSPKPVVKINSIVNEKYLCHYKKGSYSHEVIKYRVAKNAPDSLVNGEVPETIDDDPIRKECQDIKTELEITGKLVTKNTMKTLVVRKIKAGMLDKSLRPALIKYIEDNCPEGLR